MESKPDTQTLLDSVYTTICLLNTAKFETLRKMEQKTDSVTEALRKGRV